MKDVAIVGYCRTGIAKAQRGALNQTHGIAMASHVMKHAVARAKIDAGDCGITRERSGKFAVAWGHTCRLRARRWPR